MADIVLINPRFDMSFWGMELVLPFMGRRANMPVASLPLLAALTPSSTRVTLIDENVEAIDFDRCARADIVGVTGMGIQRRRMQEILLELKRRGVFTVVAGGPMVDRERGLLRGQGRRDLRRRGRADLAPVPRRVGAGLHADRYEQAEKSDMSEVPTPRFDLLKMRHYLFGSLQFSRGCPFQCEFCDIIVTFGRRPADQDLARR